MDPRLSRDGAPVAVTLPMIPVYLGVGDSRCTIC